VRSKVLDLLQRPRIATLEHAANLAMANLSMANLAMANLAMANLAMANLAMANLAMAMAVLAWEVGRGPLQWTMAYRLTLTTRVN